MTLCFMCRKPIPPDSDEDRHHQNRQTVEYAGEPIHRDCHPQQMPEPDTNHEEVHEHLLEAARHLTKATTASEPPHRSLDVEKLTGMKASVRVMARDYKEAHLD